MVEKHIVSNIEFKDDYMYLTIDNALYEADLNKISKVLLQASIDKRRSFRVLDGGYGITWFPELNEDLSVNGLIRDCRLIEWIITF